MIISNCPRATIEAAASEVGLRLSITSLSGSGLRHRVKLYPSASKTLRVEAGEKTFYSQSSEQRARLSGILRELEERTEQRVHDSITVTATEIEAATMVKLRKIINGRTRPHYKRIALYQRRCLSNHNRACAAVCWHGFRDFFKALFAFKPDANAYTAFSKYRGLDGFLHNYPATANRNIGSAYNPMSAAEACWCDELSLA